MPVDLITFPKEGHVTFLSSEKTSFNFLPILTNMLGFFSAVFAFILYLAFPLPADLFGFFVYRMLFAERTIFIQLKTFRIVLLVFHIVIVPVFAFGAFKRDLGSVYGSHFSKNSVQKNHTSGRCVHKVYHKVIFLSIIFQVFLSIKLFFSVFFMFSALLMQIIPRHFSLFSAQYRKILAYRTVFVV